MACTVILELTLKPESVDAVKKGLKDFLPDTRAYDGCINAYATQDQDNPNTIEGIAKWESRQHQEKYLVWRQERGDLDFLSGALIAEPKFRYLDTFGE